jgi:formylglycine-generating enzyme required for sulfatase activity/energy-coupling factor transporter ATP-binding protein EcfA2
VTGDIAYSGQKDEYTLAKTFFDDLLEKLNLSDDRLFIVPGNHDVNYKIYRKSDFPNFGNEKELNDELDDEVSRKDLLKGMEEYFTFVETNYSHLKSIHDRLIPFVYSHNAKCEKKIGLVGLNSAWMCRRYHYDKKIPYKEKITFEMIAIGEYQIKLAMEELKSKGDHDLIINVFHHPLGWLWPVDREICKRYFDGNITLTGHLHYSESEYVRGSNSSIYQFMAGAAYEGSEYPNRFQYISFDWDKNKIKVDYRKFDREKRRWCVESEMGEDGVATFDMIDSVKIIEEKLKTIALDKNFETYLRAALDEHRHLPTQGFETTLRVLIELECVYVNMHANIHIQDFDLTLEGKNRMHMKIREEKLSSLDIKAAFEASKQHQVKDMVILGDPGSGKTTLLKYMLIMLIQEKGREKLGIKQKLIPFLAPLRDLKNPDREYFYDFLKRVCCLRDFSIPDKSFEELLQSGQAIVLLDGLDEVANEEMRVKTCRWIDKARKVLPYTRFVITSRFAGYQEKSRLEGSVFELSIQDFTIDEVQEFLVRWFESVETALHHGGDKEKWRKKGREDALVLVERISKSEHLRKLSVNPLLLQIIALVHRDRGTLPQRRVELYEECTNVLLEKWDMAKGLDVLLTAREARQVLQPLALWLHGVDERRSARIEEIKNVIRDPLEEIGKSCIDPEALLLNIRDRSGIFMGYSEQKFGFTHLSFQEYLAAEQIRNRRQIQTLLINFGKKWWREVILLCLALDNPSVIEEFMENLIPTEKFSQEINLVIDALYDSIRKPSKPFIHVLHDKKLSVDARDNTIRVLKGIGGDKVIHALKEVALGEDKRLAISAFEALESLGAAGEIRKPVEEIPAVFINPADNSEMVLIPAGTFLYGSREDDKIASSDEKPQRVIDLPAFYIDKFPVTNEQFCRFLNDKKPDEKSLNDWIDLGGSFLKEKCRITKKDTKFRIENGYEGHPVIYVTWYGADAYAKWAGKRLPTEQEWEKAARGTDGRNYPWGNEFRSEACNTFESKIEGTSKVDRFSQGKSPYGCYDMSGNVWEWTDSRYDEKENREVLRGGSWDCYQVLARCAFRGRFDPDSRGFGIGFRCARTITL